MLRRPTPGPIGRSRRAREVLVALSVATVLLIAVPAGLPAAGLPTHKCGSFQHRVDSRLTYRITVLNQHITCPRARTLIRAFWSKSVVKHHHGGPGEANSWYSMAGFPGWRCYQAAGAGLCRKYQGVAAYQVDHKA